MKAKTSDIRAVLQKLDAKFRCVLVYGPDEGLVRERADQISRQVVEDLSDPFNVARPGADQIKSEPSLLADELASLSMMGGRRLIRVDGAVDGQAAAIETALTDCAGDNVMVLAAGNLSARSALRKLIEKAPNAIALPCYADSARDVEDVVRSTIRDSGHRITPDAVMFLVANLGNDRAVTRSELEKLVLYKGAEPAEITLDDARAIVTDQSAMDLSDIAIAVTGGEVKALDALLEKAYQEGDSPIAVLRVLSWRLTSMHFVAALVADGINTDAALKRLRPPLFFKDAPIFRTQLQRWPFARLGQALVLVLEAEELCKTTGMPAEAVAARTCLRIAETIRRH